jgi:hypothetical protein
MQTYTVKPGDTSAGFGLEGAGPAGAGAGAARRHVLVSRWPVSWMRVTRPWRSCNTELTTKLKKFISDPVVTVSIQEIKGNKVYVIGQVQKPGDFVVNPRVDVMQALSMAGGTTPFAALGDIMILRRNDTGQQQALPFKYTDVVRGRNLQQNIILQAGDVVVVP